jgi:integrase/recombinase XerC
MIKAAYQFLEYLRVVKMASAHTVRNYSIDLNSLKSFLESDILALPADKCPEKISYTNDYEDRNNEYDESLILSSIDHKILRRFLASLIEANVHKRTVVRRLSSLRTFFKFCVRHNLLPKSPAEALESPRLDKRIPNVLSYDQVQRFFDQPDTENYLGFRDRCIMELFYSSGLRVSELVGLNRTDVDSGSLLLKVRGKGKKERLLPITKNAADWIKAYLEHPERNHDIDGHLGESDREAVFLNRLGTRLTTRSVDRKFEKYLASSGLATNITPHTIRHTIATHWLENGMDFNVIRRLLGHISSQTATLYAQVSSKLKKVVYDQTHPRA